MFLSKHRCYLCVSEKTENNCFVCLSCFARLQSLRWEGCSRCGLRHCQNCSGLKTFSKIESLYSYQAPFSTILDLAKSKYDQNAQKAFFDLFFVPTKRFFIKLFQEKQYSHVILSPLRKERLFFSSWHTNVFYEQLLLQLKEELQWDHVNLISLHFLSQRQKQALIPSSERKKFDGLSGKNKIYISHLKKYDQDINHQNILLLDDVLTTGQTAFLCQQSCQPHFQNCSWDLFTLFRTPQKGV